MLKGRVIALVDDEDAWALEFSWHLNAKGYVRRTLLEPGREAHPRLHREILGLAFGDPREGDHIDGNKLDNRRRNLQILTNTEHLRKPRT